ncbi:MAG TPA: hypothetical protein VGG56_00395 [Terracidiphilus sp.]|jgi:uncharacterized membrane protein (DUF485 family)
MWLKPLYHASVSTTAGLLFGLLPLWISWILLLLRGEFLSKYDLTLSKGDVLMVACSLAGSALVLGFRKREPETLPMQEVFGVLGIGLVLFCSIVSVDASPEFHIFTNQFTQKVVFNLTLIFLPICGLYAVFMVWQSERSLALRDLASFRRLYDVNGDGLNIKF